MLNKGANHFNFSTSTYRYFKPFLKNIVELFEMFTYSMYTVLQAWGVKTFVYRKPRPQVENRAENSASDGSSLSILGACPSTVCGMLYCIL